ncbi:hypothetical protein SLEP1_g58027 [Rubroshorea leprosula]|uniref:Uncharacterized protein n=1 Tax=Rubroshorea leprosula TaxID=152421 RepID=A0AAV5MP86_9ROSI|nr:hypothetical protein SLEP1_g58027 [Rubroshorea leprosula]
MHICYKCRRNCITLLTGLTMKIASNTNRSTLARAFPNLLAFCQ